MDDMGRILSQYLIKRISQNPVAAKFVFKIVQPLYERTGISAALLLGAMQIFK